MMWVYQTLDIIATLTEAFALYLFSICLCKQPRFRPSVNKMIIIGIDFLFVYAMTWFTELGAYKVFFWIFFSVILLKFCYKDSFIQCAISCELSMVATSMMSEGIGMLLGRFIYHDNMIIVMEGNSLARWEIYVITLTVRIITLWITYMVCRKFCYRITWKDFLVVTAVFLIAWLFFFFYAFNHLNLGQTKNSADVQWLHEVDPVKVNNCGKINLLFTGFLRLILDDNIKEVVARMDIVFIVRNLGSQILRHFACLIRCLTALKYEQVVFHIVVYGAYAFLVF